MTSVLGLAVAGIVAFGGELSVSATTLPGGPSAASASSSTAASVQVASQTLSAPIVDRPSSATAPSEPGALQRVTNYVVQPGDSIRTIAQQFHVSNETVIWANDLANPDLLRPGEKLEILPFDGVLYQVHPGDTVASIASVYQARVQDIISANALTPPYVILSGQNLLVPGGRRPVPVVPAPRPAPAAKPATAPTAASLPHPSNGSAVAPPAGTQQQAAAATAPTPVPAPPPKQPVLGNTPQDQFIRAIYPAAQASEKATGVPASVTIAQAILESYWGTSRLAQVANNYFGIKAETQPGPAGVVWMSVWEVSNGQNIVVNQPFRAYANMEQSFVDHGRFFVDNSRYAHAMAVRSDPKQFAVEIARAGYATDPAYASKLIALMDRFNLYQFDS